MTKPIIAVTGPARRLKFGWWATRLRLSRVGLKAQYITSTNPELPDQVAGVIISGGDDIDPKHYGRTGTAGANYDVARDTLELKVIEYALANRLPMLGICRGAQLINIARGGNLHQDIRPKRVLTPNRNSLFSVKNAQIVPDSMLYSILGCDNTPINSLHSQAVDKCGDSLIPVAYDKDGFVQAIEDPNHEFLLGTQWHPEYMLWSHTQSKIFKRFAQVVSTATPS